MPKSLCLTLGAEIQTALAKKRLQALEQKRKDVPGSSYLDHPPLPAGTYVDRLAFVDETWLKTNMIKRTGWAP